MTKKCIFVFTVFLNYPLLNYPMEKPGEKIRTQINHRYCLIVAMLTHLREQAKNPTAFPGHPKALMHFILTGQSVAEEIADEFIAHQDYFNESTQVAQLLTLQAYQTCELEPSVSPKTGPIRVKYEAEEALARYYLRKKNNKQYTLNILPTLQQYRHIYS